MKTIIDAQNEGTTLQQRIDAAKMVEVLRTGLFGAYHYKVKDWEFEEITIGRGFRAISYWVGRKNGKEYTMKYKYVFNITMRNLGFIK